jgi:geranylgeranylglycerol-phosphate geranylgeranyltransferase
MRGLTLKKLQALWQLFRLEHGFMYGVGVWIGAFIAVGLNVEINSIIFGFLTALFLQAGTFALNDYYDFEVDKANKRRDRPLVRGDLTKQDAMRASLIMIPLGLITAALVNFPSFVLALIITVMGVLYDVKIKETGLGGNSYIAFTMAAPFIYGSVVATRWITWDIAMLSIIAFSAGLGREIMKGIEDVHGDALRNVRSIARELGERKAGIIAGILFGISVAFSPIPYLHPESAYHGNLVYLGLVFITDVILMYVTVSLWRKRDYSIKNLRKVSLTGLFMGLMAFLAGIIIR